ncbi:CTP-dependent diacylglycerol kinase 1 [Spathaspora sp. JA1]|nr:CTP-dependent diacylglycerol kinase 1 [Spathaspora sp. JA1]
MSVSPAIEQEERLRSEIKATIMDFDSNASYIEEDDMTYIYSSSIIDEDDDIDDSSLVDDDDDEDTETTDGDEGTLDEVLDDTEIDQKVRSASPQTVIPSTENIPSSETTSKFREFLVKHEIPRKLFHSSIGVITLYLYTIGIDVSQLFLPLSTIFCAVLANDLIRLHNPELNKIICQKMWFIIRESEMEAYNGVLYYLAGVLIVFYFFPKDIGVVSVLLLSWADTAASTFGRQFGKYTPKLGNGKSVAGSLASWITGTLAAYLFYGYFVPQYNVNGPQDIFWTAETSKLNIHTYAILCGLGASVSEFIDLWGLDDNFTIPVLSGTFLYWLVRYCHV